MNRRLSNSSKDRFVLLGPILGQLTVYLEQRIPLDVDVRV